MNSTPLKRHAFGLVITLGIEFLLGMWVNLYTKFPETKNAAELWKFSSSQAVVIIHIIVGTALLIGASTLVIRARKSGRKFWQVSSIIGLIAIIFAWLSGRDFISRQDPISSLAMALFFLIALFCYITALYLANADETSGLHPRK